MPIDVTPTYFDIAAWAEDRAALRELRQEAEDARVVVAVVTTILRQDARKIHAACDLLDNSAFNLGRLASGT